MDNVLLGFPEQQIVDQSEVDYTTNKIGGLPNWHKPQLNASPHTSAVACRLCSYPAPMVTQLYAPLENSNYHRTLYVFACISPGCWNRSESWVCLRAQSLDAASKMSVEEDIVNTNQFCEETTDWNTYNTGDRLTLSSLAEALRNIVKPCNQEKYESLLRSNQNLLMQTNKPAPTPVAPKIQPASSSVFEEVQWDEQNANKTQEMTSKGNQIENAVNIPEEAVVAENSKCCAQTTCAKRNPTQMLSGTPHVFAEEGQESNPRPGDGSSKNVDGVTGEYAHEDYEKALPKHGDELFHAMMKKVSQNPGQVIRYCRNNKSPLFLLKQSTKEPMRCPHCSAEMIFELQILSTVISHLRPHNASFDVMYPLEFGSAYVYTCKDSCWDDEQDVREEIVIVQAENFPNFQETNNAPLS